MNFRKVTAIILTAITFLSLPVSAKTLEFTVGDSNLYICDGAIEKVTLDAPVYIKDGRTLVPVRAIIEAFGAEVLWNGDERKVTIKSGGSTIELVIDSCEAVVNGEIKTLDVAPTITNSRTMMPIRFVSEILSKNVEYVEPSSQILISDSNVAISVDGYPITVDDFRFMYLYYCLAQGVYEPEEIMPVIISDVITNTCIANDAKRADFSLLTEQTKEIAQSILYDKELFYPLSLVAPGIKTFANLTLASEYCYNMLTSGLDPEILVKEYNESYVCAKHVLIPTVNLETGEALNNNQLLAAKATADAVYKKAKNGEDFDELIEKYSSDEGSVYYPEGYVFTYGEMVPEFEKTAFNLSENEISKPVKTSYGYHIILRLPLPEMNYMYEETISTKVAQSQLEKYTDNVIGNANVKYHMTNEEIAQSLGITKADAEEYIKNLIAQQ